MSRPDPGVDVVVLGEGLVVLQADGRLPEAALYRRSQGGDGLLAAIAASRLGARVAFVTRVGDDPFGEWMLESWAAEGLRLDFTRRVRGRNPVMLVGAEADGHRRLVYRDGAAATGLEPGDVERLPWHLVRVLHAPGSMVALGAEPWRMVHHAFEEARSAGVRTVYEADGAAREAAPRGGEAAPLDEVLPSTSVLAVGAPWAAGRVLGHAEPEEAAREAVARGAPGVVVRHGLRGAAVGDAAGTRQLEPVSPPELRQSLTASAAFVGGVLAGLARDLELPAAAALGQQAMALAQAGPAAPEGLPWLDQLDELRRRLGYPPLG